MMRWWCIPILMVLAWFAFTLSPLWSLYDLARAVQARDVGYVERHVNFRTLRQSLIRQAASAASSARTEPGADAEAPRERQRLVDAAAALAEPLTESLLTPGTVIDLLDDGIPQSLHLGGSRSGAPDPAVREAAEGRPLGLRIDTVLRLVPYYFASEMRGFRTVVIAVPPEASRARQFRVRLRLRNWSWRLVEIDLTDDLRERIADKLSRIKGREGGGPDGGAPPGRAVR